MWKAELTIVQSQVLKAQRDSECEMLELHRWYIALLTKVPNQTDDNTSEKNWENPLLVVKKEHWLLIKTGGKTQGKPL